MESYKGVSILRLQSQTQKEPINWFFYLQIIIHADKGRERISPCQAVVNGKHSANVVDKAALGVVGEPKQLRREAVLEATVGPLIADFKAIAPI